jgi:chemotaxis methyl-accepting protein methylase
MIVCKNVLLHFPAPMRVSVLDMFHSALADNGILVLEHTQKMPVELAGRFEWVAENASIYRKKAGVMAIAA